MQTGTKEKCMAILYYIPTNTQKNKFIIIILYLNDMSVAFEFYQCIEGFSKKIAVYK